MEQAARLIESYFKVSAGWLEIGGRPVGSLVETYGTPLYVYDSAVLERKWARLRQALPEKFELYYSIKANPNPAILEFFVRLGCGLEVASAGELERGMRAGCPPQRIVFAGPGKTEAELEAALEKRIGELHVESLLEIRRLGNIARRLRTQAQVAVRVNPGGEIQGGALQMGGKPAPFGVDEEDLDEALEAILAEPALEFCGLHFYLGTQILDHRILISQYRQGVEIARRAASQAHRPLKTVDFGGGLGIPYFPGESELELDQFRVELAGLLLEFKDEPAFADARFLLEPGRYLVGEAGVYITRVNDIKVSRGKKFLVTDGGMNHHLAASGNLGQVIKRNFPIAILNKLGREPAETVDVVGPLCTPLDVLARQVALPEAEVGDLVGIFQSGAYARSASPLGFLSHPAPPEVWVEAGMDLLSTPRGVQ